MSVTIKEDVINCKLGKACVPGMVISGYAFIVGGIYPAFTEGVSGLIGGVALIIFGCFLAFTTTGVDLDIKHKTVNTYYAYFNILKIRKGIDIDQFEYVSVVMTNKENVIYSRSNRSNSQIVKKYEVHLINKSTKKEQIIASYNHMQQATEFAKEIAKKIDLEYIRYDSKLFENS